ncbi:MAG: serine hydrolase [Syntrophobacteraceae bacterium]
MQLAERSRLHLDDPVATHWPEFAANGKGQVKGLKAAVASIVAVAFPLAPPEAPSNTPVEILYPRPQR